MSASNSYCHVHDAVAVNAYGMRYYIDIDENNFYDEDYIIPDNTKEISYSDFIKKQN